MIPRIPRTLRRAAFILFAVVIIVATHWPRLTIRIGDLERPDLFIHFAVFSLWALLLWASELLGPLRSFSVIGLVWLVAALYAAADEASQLLPFIHRHAAWDDLAANIGGVTIGSLAALAAARSRLTRPTPR